MFLVLVVLLCVVAATTQSLPQSHIDECVSLLEFRANFTMEPYYALRKLQPWKMKKGVNCCGWDGVQCDAKLDGHVVGLDLSDSGFRGSIDSGSSLFRLSHLQTLNLGGIYMGSSTIPPAIGNLSRLTTLNLSLCGFLAPLPDFSGLTNLSSLDLSGNIFLDTYDIGNLTKILPKLQQLRLSYLRLNSAGFPTGIENLSSLRSLIIDHSDLGGNFPVAIFKLPKLEHVDISVNPQLSGYFPEFQSWRSRLKSISISFTNFSGELPLSLGSLGSLNVLDVSNCYFRGSIPSSLSNLTNLSVLRLSSNNFNGSVPCLASLLNLTSLELSKNHLSGDVLSYIGTHIMLERLDLSYNNFTGSVPYGFGNLTRLVYVDLASNGFHGEVDLDLVLHLNKDIRILRLQFNKLSVIANSGTEMNDNSANHLKDLQLANCNLQEFPKVLQNQTELFRLDLSSNNMKGAIPVWFKTISSESLVLLNLSHNSLTGFVVEDDDDSGSWRILGSLDLRYNELQGSLPPPPPSIFDYLVSNNKLTGEVSSDLFCNCSNIQTIELSNNRLNGTIPECLSSSGNSLRILSLHGNDFSGTIPSKLFQEGKCVNLQMMDFSNNQLEGPLPRSLSSCGELRLLNFGGNNIRDTFPSWLVSVDKLRVLILRSNKFHGEIMLKDDDSFIFNSLHIIDISHNEFTGYLSTRQIDGWRSMKADSQEEPREYLRTSLPTYLAYDRGTNDDTPLFLDGLTSYDFSMKIVNKGSEMVYEKILNYLMVVDLSSNNFIGRVPSAIGSLVRVHQLNLSNNALTGPIPAFFGDLMKLEALDLSHNNFSGKIPDEITRLNFLGVFNVSCNNLSGRIPQGGQFDTFLNSSYVDNQGLCGVPVSRKCETDITTPPASWKNRDADDDESSRPSSVIIEWKAVVVGYATSFIIAAIIGFKFITVRRPFRLGTQEIRRRRQR